MNNEVIKKIEATLEKRFSEKKQSYYECIVIKLTPNVEKVVYLEKAEIELLKLLK